MNETKHTLMEKFWRVYALLHRQMSHGARSAGPFGNPHRGQGRVLALLRMKPEITQKELGYLLDMRNQSLGELLAKLEKNGFITRTPSETDRRTTNIRLTEEGRKAAEKTEKEVGPAEKFFSALNEEEQEQMGRLLDKLCAAAQTEMGQGRGGAEGRPGGLEDFFYAGNMRPRRPAHHHQPGQAGYDPRQMAGYPGWEGHPGMDARRMRTVDDSFVFDNEEYDGEDV